MYYFLSLIVMGCIFNGIVASNPAFTTNATKKTTDESLKTSLQSIYFQTTHMLKEENLRPKQKTLIETLLTVTKKALPSQKAAPNTSDSSPSSQKDFYENVQKWEAEFEKYKKCELDNSYLNLLALALTNTIQEKEKDEGKLSHHDNEPQNVRCPYKLCKERFYTEEGLDVHINTTHPQSDLPTRTSSSSKKQKTSDNNLHSDENILIISLTSNELPVLTPTTLSNHFTLFPD